MMLRNYVEECIDIVADALEPIVTEKIPEIDSNDVRALFKAIAHERWNDFRGVVGRNNRSRLYTLLDIANTIYHKKKDTGLDQRQISEMFNSSIFLLEHLNAKEILDNVKSLEQKFNLEMNPKSQDAPASFSSQGVSVSCSSKINLSEKSIEIAKHLVECAKNRTILTYGEIGKKVNLRPNSKLLFDCLDQINYISNERKDVLLSILVVNKDRRKPSPQFFDKAVKLWGKDLSTQSHEDFFYSQCILICQIANAGELDFFLGDDFSASSNKDHDCDNLPYNMGNIGDLLKHGMMAEFIRRWSNKKSQKEFVFLDPFCGLGWEQPAKEGVLMRLHKLRAKHGSNFAIFSAQPDIDDHKYYGSTHVVINQAHQNKLLPVVRVSDQLPKRTTELITSDEKKRITKIECKGFLKNDGYSILDSIIDGHINADMVLIDPFYKIDKIKDVIPKIIKASNKTAVVLFVLLKVNKDDAEIWKGISTKLSRKTSIISTCPPLNNTKIDGEGAYGIGVILFSDLIDDTLRKNIKSYAVALTNTIGKTIQCE